MRAALFLAIAILLNTGAGYGAWRRRSVTAGGAVAGALTGAVILVAGGWVYWMLLMLFFVSSSVASHLGGGRKAALERMHAKGSRRDQGQVFANGGVAAIAVMLLFATGGGVFGVVAAAAFASVTADTWASEFGVLSTRRPRSIVTWRSLEPGTSGGVSLLGSAAAAAGSGLIASFFALACLVAGGEGLIPGSPLASAWGASPDAVVLLAESSVYERRLAGAAMLFVVVFVSGMVGTTVDSLLGATLQAQYRRPDGSLTERPSGDDGDYELVRGLRSVTNDTVNLASAAFAAIFALFAAASIL